MPLWSIYHPSGTFVTPASKQAFSESITTFYNKNGTGLPKFYVIVNFIQLPGDSMYIGGRPNTSITPFIRLKIDHIAITLPDKDDVYASVTKGLDAVLKPHIADKGYDWEYHVDETERRLWKVQGLNPPPWKSEAERLWREGDKAVPWEDAKL
jgi:hypothetical protein